MRERIKKTTPLFMKWQRELPPSLWMDTLDLSILLGMFTFVEKKRQTLLFQNVKGFNFDMSLPNKYTNADLISSFNLNFYNSLC